MATELVKKIHKEIFGNEPEIIVYAPGRVNLIGEHTDYSEGYVMPTAIDMGITVGISKIPDSMVLAVYSMDYQKKMVSMFSDLVKSKDDWFNYPLGVVKTLLKHDKKFAGIRITFTGNIPQGAGLSSSAALEVAVGEAINQLYNLKIPKVEMAKICQQAEREFVGVNCGIMDQYISLLGEKGTCLFIDCRTLEYEKVPLNLGKNSIVITNSNVPHKLHSSKYNERVQECQEAVKILSVNNPGTHLRDFTLEDFEKNKKLMSENIQKRAIHVISENERVLEAKKALKNDDLHTFGELMLKSHESLKENYEVSSNELDWLVETASKIDGCYGSRLTGAGFGGCTVSLMEKDAIPIYQEKLKNYTVKFGYKAVIYEISSENGAYLLPKIC